MQNAIGPAGNATQAISIPPPARTPVETTATANSQTTNTETNTNTASSQQVNANSNIGNNIDTTA